VWCQQQPQVPSVRNIINQNEHLKFDPQRDQNKFEFYKNVLTKCLEYLIIVTKNTIPPSLFPKAI
jgi:hypothetical protein